MNKFTNDFMFAFFILFWIYFFFNNGIKSEAAEIDVAWQPQNEDHCRLPALKLFVFVAVVVYTAKRNEKLI